MIDSSNSDPWLQGLAVILLQLFLILLGCKEVEAQKDLQDAHTADPLTGEISFQEQSIHPLQRERAFPGDGANVSFSPPAFLWPAVYDQDVEFINISGALYPSRPHDVKYSFRLSNNPDFEGEVYYSQNKKWAFYNHHKKLTPGKWYWQYGSSIGGADYNWSEVMHFWVDENAIYNETPSYEKFLDAIPQSHPRILTNGNQIQTIRDRYNNGTLKAIRIIRLAEKELSKRIPKEENALPPSEVLNNKGMTNRGLEVAKREASKTLAKNMSNSIQHMVMAYLLTGEEKYGQSALQWGLRTASFEPNGIACKAHFADARHMRNMAWVFDACHDLMSETQKEKLSSAIKVRASKYHKEWVNGLENITNSGHVWQQLHFYQIQTALAMLHHTTEANEWLEYAYGVFLAKAPALSSALDGSWANGTNYMSANQSSILNTSLILKNVTNHNFLENPWFKNNAWFVIHGIPYGGPLPSFGDSFEKHKGMPSSGTINYMEFLGKSADIDHAAWYAQKATTYITPEKKRSNTFGTQSSPVLTWFSSIYEHKTPSNTIKDIDITQARAFRDVGIVSMHSRIGKAAEDNVLYFKSGPFGSVCNHAHAANNAFNIAIKGKMMFSPIGIRNLTKYSSSDTHNTILVDGQGQVNGSSGYGWVPRYLHGEKLTYAVGDASNAYEGKTDLIRRLVNPDADEEVFSSMERFRRHIVMIRPSVFVIYDDLIGSKETEWTWQLHSNYQMEQKDQVITVQAEDGTSACAQLFSSVPLEAEVTSYTPETTEDFKINLSKKYGKLKTQYSYRAKNNDGAKRLRVIAIITDGGASALKSRLKVLNDGSWELDGWMIKAEMDPEKPSDLLVTNHEETIGLSTGYSSLRLGEKTYERKSPGSTILVENGSTQEVVDELPEAAR